MFSLAIPEVILNEFLKFGLSKYFISHNGCGDYMALSKRSQKLFVIVISAVVITAIASFSYLVYYTDIHSSYSIGVKIVDNLENNNSDIVAVTITAIINQTNFLTKFDFIESNGLGLGLFYSQNLSDINNPSNCTKVIPFQLDNANPSYSTTVQLPDIAGYYMITRGPTNYESAKGLQTSFYFEGFSRIAYFVSNSGSVSQIEV